VSNGGSRNLELMGYKGDAIILRLLAGRSPVWFGSALTAEQNTKISRQTCDEEKRMAECFNQWCTLRLMKLSRWFEVLRRSHCWREN